MQYSAVLDVIELVDSLDPARNRCISCGPVGIGDFGDRIFGRPEIIETAYSDPLERTSDDGSCN